jgi:thymidine phosphorylase
MDEPLGFKVGNSLELEESIDVLNGRGPADVTALALELASHMVKLAKPERRLPEIKKECAKNLYEGKALEKFREMISVHGGDKAVTDDTSLLGRSPLKKPLNFSRSGYLSSISTSELGLSLVRLGAGRLKLTDRIDPTVGIILNRKVGDRIEKGETVAWICYGSRELFEREFPVIRRCFRISSSKPQKKKLILGTIR